MGLFQRGKEGENVGLYKRGGVWWILYYDRGRRFRESSESDKKGTAQELLAKRKSELAEGKRPGYHFRKTTLDDLARL